MKKSKKHESLASLLDSSVSPSEREAKLAAVQEDKLQQLLFLWDDCRPAEAATDGVLAKTMQKIAMQHRKTVLRAWIWSAAAAVVLLAGGLSYLLLHESDCGVQEMERHLQASVAVDDVTEVTLVVSDQQSVQIANNSTILYSAANQIQIQPGNVEAAQLQTLATDAGEHGYNQLIVPKGCRSVIVLADGSKIWLNSGTKVVYPCSFTKGKRRIFIEGEAYLQVAHDTKKPFVVSTAACDVEVLGTSFNVTACKNAAETSVVLVEGAVKVTDRQAHHVKMQPNDRVKLNGTDIQKEKVNVADYIAWVEGVWTLEGKPLKDVLQRLAEYYGKQIYCAPEIADEPVYGKLYLNDDLEKVLSVIHRIVSITCGAEKDLIHIE